LEGVVEESNGNRLISVQREGSAQGRSSASGRCQFPFQDGRCPRWISGSELAASRPCQILHARAKSDRHVNRDVAEHDRPKQKMIALDIQISQSKQTAGQMQKTIPYLAPKSNFAAQLSLPSKSGRGVARSGDFAGISHVFS
jgi:hypothetical protein